MAITMVENLRGFSQSRPPIVVFMICLGAFAVALITFAYIVKVKDFPNPDMAEDWNTFLESFADVEFCVMSNSSDYVTESSSSPTPSSSDKISKLTQDLMPTTPSNTPQQEGVVNVSLQMLVEMQPTTDFVSIPHNVTYLSTTLTGNQLGLQGNVANLDVNVTFTLPFEWNTTRCIDEECDPVKILTCISFQAPVSFFPRTSRPKQCPAVVEGGVEYHVKMIGFSGRKNKVWCRSRPVIQMKYKLDPTLTVMLSLHDRSVINLHLMHTSYFLFVMVVTMFCYAIIRGRPSKGKIVHYIEKVPTQAY
ncbi:hypothetical protein SNE40_002717 [Patella caerulea]|uniref:TMEM248/TMEM219 domain-containing protein n=1 Tax=Patella caerulea TaxID=87958 RepID=A0AAN8K8C1_PATCE